MSTDDQVVIRGKVVTAPREWFVFGEDRVSMRCDISDGEDDVLVNLPIEMVEEVLAARKRKVQLWWEWAEKQPRETK